MGRFSKTNIKAQAKRASHGLVKDVLLLVGATVVVTKGIDLAKSLKNKEAAVDWDTVMEELDQDVVV